MSVISFDPCWLKKIYTWNLCDCVVLCKETRFWKYWYTERKIHFIDFIKLILRNVKYLFEGKTISNMI